MIQTVLDILTDLGTATTDVLWLPVLAWTVLALPLWTFLNRTDRLHPNAEYRLSQVLLAALPTGIAAVSVVEMLPDAARSTVLFAQSVVVLPTIETTSVGTPAVAWSWMHAVGLLTVGTLGVMLFQLGRLGLEIVAVGRVRRRLEGAPPPSLQDEINRFRERLKIRRPVQLCLSSDAAVPMTLGGLRPTILVPERLMEAPKELRMTLRHELVHIRRWDDIAHFVERFVAALFAAHPLVGRLRRQIAEARERACDAAVLDDGETPPGDYARLLAAFADGASTDRRGALSLSESPSSLTDRLSAMRSSMPSLLSSRFTLGTVLVTIGLVLTFGVIACSDSVAPPPAPDAPATSESSPSSAAEEDEVFMDVEEPPELVGGAKALENAVSYPELAKEAGIEGQVIVRFVVDKNGNVTNTKVLRGVNKALNQAAVKAVRAQEFRPGKQRGEPVKVRMSLPVTFRLDDGADGASNNAATPSGTSTSNSRGRLFEKAGIQVVRVLMNEKGQLLLDDEQVKVSNLADAVRQHITKDAARAALLYADGAPADRVAAVAARLRALDLQKVYLRKV
ncbi:MAG: TonB family protein [Salinibacter sp.]